LGGRVALLRTFYLPSLKNICIFIKTFAGKDTGSSGSRTAQAPKTLAVICPADISFRQFILTKKNFLIYSWLRGRQKFKLPLGQGLGLLFSENAFLVFLADAFCGSFGNR